MKRTTIGLLAAGLLLSAAAQGDVLGDLVSGGKSPGEGFAGTWTAPAGSDIDHIVVTASSSGPVRIQVFGRCETKVCNWGALAARIRTDGPTSQNVRALSADFNLGFALRHITLHRQPGNMLRFDMVTEFTDGSDRHDYETAGQLLPAGTGSVSAPAPAAAEPAPPSAPPPSAGSGITALNPLNWFGSKPAAPAGGDASTAVAAGAGVPLDDCFAIDAAHAYIVNANGNWNVRDFLHVVQGFGPYRAAADKGLKTIVFYRFDEVCRIGRSTSNMTFFRASGEVPHQPMPGQDCLDVHPENVAAVKHDDDWQVVDGDRVVFNYGSDRDGATKAVSVIKTLALSHQCYYDRANLAASYWLSR
jgi:hypothetical protein